MQPHESHHRRPDPEDGDIRLNTQTVWLIVIIAGLLAAITTKTMGFL
jgi:hypothetical protein